MNLLRRRPRHISGGCTHPPMLSCGWKNSWCPPPAYHGLSGCHGNGAAVCRHDSLPHPCARDAPAHTAPQTATVRNAISSLPTPVLVYLTDRLYNFLSAVHRLSTITFAARVVNLYVPHSAGHTASQSALIIVVGRPVSSWWTTRPVSSTY